MNKGKYWIPFVGVYFVCKDIPHVDTDVLFLNAFYNAIMTQVVIFMCAYFM